MIPQNSKKILLFLLRNLEPANINQVSRRLGISVGSAFKIMKDLEKRGVLTFKIFGNAKYYRINLNDDESVKLLEFLLLEEMKNQKGHVKLYINDIQKFDGAELIILFGSVLTEKEFNDIDVLFVTNKSKKVSEFCLGLSKIRAKPVVPLILKKEDLINELENKREPILDIIKKGIVAKGESTFLEVLKNAKI